MFSIDKLALTIESEFDITRWQNQLINGIVFRVADEERLLIRAMRLTDIPEIIQIERRVFADPWTEDQFIYDLYYERKNLALVGLIADEIVAYLLSIFVIDELHLHNIAVSPAFQHKGIGKVMLWYMLSAAGYEGADLCHLEVRASNQNAIELYRKFGFDVVGRRKAYYQNNNEDALLMSKRNLCNMGM